METELILQTNFDVNQQSRNDVVSCIDELGKHLEKAWSDPLATLEKHVSDNLTELGTAWGNTLNEGWKKSASTLGTAITDSISPFFDGEMDKVGDIWAKAWNDKAHQAGNRPDALCLTA